MMSNVRRKNLKTAAVCFTVVAGMVGLAFASVPLYRLFCQVTGFDGTPGIAASAPGAVSDQHIAVRFDSNVSPALGWKFHPLEREVTLKLGEERLAFFEATNMTDKKLVGTATFNVTPLKVGQYFVKIECFCFTEQVLDPGQTVEMPVTFYVDPEIRKDKNTEEVETITLSYTFFPKPDAETKVSAVKAASKQPNNGG